MKKAFFLLILFLLHQSAKGVEVKIVHSPEIKSEISGIVIIPSKNTPYEFSGYIEENVKENTKLEVINREIFSDFLKKENIGREKITSKDLIKIYKAFGKIGLIFLNLKELTVSKKDLKGKSPCKEGKIKFAISIFHSRDGIVLKNKTVEFEITVCSKTPLYPETKEVIKALFENSSNEILKTIWPWSEVINLPEPDKTVCKNKEILDNIFKNNFKKAEKTIEKNSICYNKNPSQFYLIKGYIEFFRGNFKKSADFLLKAKNSGKENEKLSTIAERIKQIDKKTVMGLLLVSKNSKKTQFTKPTQQKYYVNQYKNNADILLEKLAELEKLYKSGKISKEEYMEKKYKLIEQF